MADDGNPDEETEEIEDDSNVQELSFATTPPPDPGEIAPTGLTMASPEEEAPAPAPAASASRPDEPTLQMDGAVPVPERPTITPANDAAYVQPGEIWDGDFEFIRLLGKGGMGAVYLAHQVSLDRPVAIKVLPTELSKDINFRRRFDLEAKAVARINSPHVTQVFTTGQHGGHHYFVMEYVDGRDLSARLRGGYRPSHAESLELVMQAAQGLAAAARHGIIHRDIKPGNMMLTEDGRLKLMDFGLVKIAKGEDTSMTMAATVMGTASYFSPEQGMGDACDGRTDIYALGVVFYELLTGRLPFTGKNTTAVIFKHIHEDPKPPQEIDPTIPESYQAVVLKCLQKDPNHRYNTADQLIEDLRRIVDGDAPQTALSDPRQLRTGATITKTRAFAKERRAGRRSVLLTLFFILAIGAAAGWYWRAELETQLRRWLGAKDAPPIDQPDDPRLRQAREALAADRLEEVARLLAEVGEPGTRPPAWEQLAKELAIRERAKQTAGARRELDRISTLLGAGDLGGATAALDKLKLVELDEGDRRRLDELVDKAAKLRQFLELGDAALLTNDLASAQQNYSNANLVVANAAATRGLTVTSACKRFEQALAKQDLDKARDILAEITAAKPDPRVVTQREHRLTATGHAIAAYARLEKGDLAEAKRLVGEIEKLDTDNPALADLRRRLDLGARETAFAAALQAEDVAAAEKLLAEISQLDPAAGTAAKRRLEKLKAVIAQREAEAAAQRLAEQQRREALKARVAALKGSLAGAEPDLAAAEKELAALGEALPEEERAQLAPLRERLGVRRTEAEARALLVSLDRAVLAGDRAAVTAIVTDATHREACLGLIGQEDLTFAHAIDRFEIGETTVVHATLTTAMKLVPERGLAYRYRLQRGDSGWTIVEVTRPE